MSRVFEAIVAVDNNNGIAKNGKIPWKSKTDMQFFKIKTLNNVVVMGTNTFLSLPNSAPLKDRLNIILTRDLNSEKNKELYQQIKKYDNILFMTEEQFLIFIKTPETYINLIEHSYLFQDYSIYLIGGQQIYNTFCKFCSAIWITKIKSEYDCDLIFSYDLTNYDKSVNFENDELAIFKMFPKHLNPK